LVLSWFAFSFFRFPEGQECEEFGMLPNTPFPNEYEAPSILLVPEALRSRAEAQERSECTSLGVGGLRIKAKPVFASDRYNSLSNLNCIWLRAVWGHVLTTCWQAKAQ
jgi:hypothetical protein